MGSGLPDRAGGRVLELEDKAQVWNIPLNLRILEAA